jgi:hypothetical protein
MRPECGIQVCHYPTARISNVKLQYKLGMESTLRRNRAPSFPRRTTLAASASAPWTASALYRSASWNSGKRPVASQRTSLYVLFFFDVTAVKLRYVPMAVRDMICRSSYLCSARSRQSRTRCAAVSSASSQIHPGCDL